MASRTNLFRYKYKRNTISGKISSLLVKQIEGNLHLDAIDAKGHLYTQKAIIQVHQSKQKVFAFLEWTIK